jgi:O-antigen ligase
MWITFGLTIAIGFFWISKMILRRQLIFRRTILDIPILLFLASQVISTIFSLDRHVSLWGFYSRWNGGLLSIVTYIFLYYGFVSNLANVKTVMRSLVVSVIAGLLVVAWALPSHFGHDPTCLAFRHTFDVSCWTADFQPKIRMFGTLGQPDWLAGYLAILLPISGAFVINELRKTKKYLGNRKLWFYSVSFVLFYVSLLFTESRAGIGGSIISLLVFAGLYIWLNKKNLGVVKNKFFVGLIAVLAILSFLIGVQLPVINKISFDEIKGKITKSHTATLAASETTTPPPVSNQELGGSNSFEIRKIVWRGAINAWRANPIFGTGVETYAFAYYKYKPAEQNRVSEWNFLYNKAHNEYLNYLATTGIVGLLSYLSFIALFGAFVKTNLLNLKFKQLKFLKAEKVWDKEDPLMLSLLMSFFAILIINFFGFSVVIMNIYLFLIPAFALILYNFFGKEISERKVDYISYFQWLLVCAIAVLGAFMVFMLIRYWRADVKYALGSNYDQAQQFQTAYPLLHDAVTLRKEPVMLDEMSVNDAILATALATQGGTESAQLVQNLATEALNTSNELIKQYPNNTVYWKSRVRVLYTLSNIDPSFSPLALEAIKKTAEMAPNDAQIIYNKGVLQGQNGDNLGAIDSLKKAVALKPDYADAQFALGVFYHEASVDKNQKITNPSYHEKALEQMKITVKINPLYTQAQEYFDLWNKEQ